MAFHAAIANGSAAAATFQVLRFFLTSSTAVFSNNDILNNFELFKSQDREEISTKLILPIRNKAIKH